MEGGQGYGGVCPQEGQRACRPPVPAAPKAKLRCDQTLRKSVRAERGRECSTFLKRFPELREKESEIFGS
jgi:hypothetical protein